MQEFKVMCVAQLVRGRVPSHLKGMKYTHPDIGETCTVVEVQESGNLTFYTLEEHGYWNEFDSRAFAILPDKSADEMSQEVKEAIVNIEQPLNA